MSTEKIQDPFASLDGRKPSVLWGDAPTTTIESLKDADEALAYLENHPQAIQIAEEGNAILEDPVQLKKLVRKIDFTIAPLLAAVYFLQFLDKTTLSYTAVMGIRKDTHLVGQDYSDLSMLFYIGVPLLPASERILAADECCRFPRCGVPYTISSTAYISPWRLLGGQYCNMGLCFGLSCCMHDLCWIVHCPDIAWYL